MRLTLVILLTITLIFWIRENLLLNNAKINLPSKQKQIDRKTQDYYNRLLIHKYQKELISRKSTQMLVLLKF